jgi:hypothetical protein
MWFIQDHLSSIIIGSVLLLVLIQVIVQGQEASVDLVQHYAGRAQATSLVTMMQGDLPNVGAGVDAADDAIVDYSWSETGGTFTFQATTDTSTTATPQTIRYQLVAADSVEVESDGVTETLPAYTLQRLVESGGTYVLTGASSSTILDLDLRLLKDDETAVSTDLDETRIIEIELEMLSSLGQDEAVGRIYWRTRFRPLNLTLTS